MSRHVFPNADALAAELVRLTIEAADNAVKARGLFSMALTGGSAATTLYPVLAQAKLPWDKVHIFFGDERSVPPEHTDSNYGLADKSFLNRVAIPKANIHRIKGELPAAEAATLYEKELAVVGDIIDVVHIGMGPDGHICSLFPGHPLLDEKTKLVAPILDSPKPPPSRVTLTMPALVKSRELWFLIAGSNKADAVRAVFTDDKCDLPAARASRLHKNVTWLLDQPAATLLKH